MLLGSLLLVGGIVLCCGRRTVYGRGRSATPTRSGRTFYVGALVSGFEPENLVTGLTAAPSTSQIALAP